MEFEPVARILVIDDDQSVIAAIEQALRGAGHQVVCAASGKEAVRRYHEQPADLIITDMYMPGQDGVDVVVQFRQIAPMVPVIAMSGNPRGEVLKVAQRLGAVAILEKPFELENLLQVVDRALNRPPQ